MASQQELPAAQDLPEQQPSAAGAKDQPPAHRSHNPQFNQKRSDPFQFGSRTLSQEDNVFEFNAWDHVETDDTYKEYSEIQYAKQREAPVSDFDKSMFSWFLFFFPPALSFYDDSTMHSSSEIYGFLNETNFSNVFRSYLIKSNFTVS